MATIANQIKRISDSRDSLRLTGRSLGLRVPSAKYWDDATNSYVQYSEAALTETDQIDKIAAAFGTIKLYRDANGKNEIRVPISVRTDGENTVVETTTLAPGYYDNTTVVPFVKVEQVEDIVINVEMISGRELNVQEAVITPAAGFNYIGQFGYKIVDGAISNTPANYGDNFVTAKVSKSGWLDADDTQKITVDKSELTKQVGTGSDVTIASGAEIIPDATKDITVKISKGIFGSDRSILVRSVASQTSGTAVDTDILDGKTAWVNGALVEGKMPNWGGVTKDAASFSNVGGLLNVKPVLGYYNDSSYIKTSILYRTIDDRVFNTTKISVGGTDTMTAQTYYETIPAGYYANDILRAVTVQDAVGSMAIDYSEHKAKLTISKAGWVDQGDIVDVAISAGEATFVLQESDLETNSVVLEPSRDEDKNITSYLTKVTVNNSIIFDLLSAI